MEVVNIYDRGLWQNVGEVLAPRSLRRSTQAASSIKTTKGKKGKVAGKRA